MGNKCETGNVKRFFLLLLGSFLSLSAWAQTGVICGTVSDAKFKDALIGASVVIEGYKRQLLMSLINRKPFVMSW